MIKRKPLGACPRENGVFFRVWAPYSKEVRVVLNDVEESFMLITEADGYFSALVPKVEAGALYKYQMDDGLQYPDPCSRYQPQGPHGPSMVVDPLAFKWQDEVWQANGLTLKGQVFYEVHVGAFSPEGNFNGLKKELNELKRVGVTVIELMPLAEFSGRWNWGYDGVGLFAPAHVYGTPEELRDLVNEAHRLSLGVILDVVYNHLGPDGNYLGIYSKDYFTKRYKNDWGDAINFDGPNSQAVRDFFITNACYWIDEFHFDGLRLDATQNIYDESPKHVLAEISQNARETASSKKIVIVGENEPQDITMITPIENGGYGLDGLLNDDFHHESKVALTGTREAYFLDYSAKPQEFISLLKYGYIYQGQFYSWQNKKRGTYVGDTFSASQFVVFLQNHDQIANSLDGSRMTHGRDHGLCRTLTALLLLAPQTPFLFMGQEFGSSSPFLFFTDHNPELGKNVTKGRKEFLCQFPSIHSSAFALCDAQDPKAFYQCKLNFQERVTNKHIYQLHIDLLRLRREDEVLRGQDRQAIDGAVLGEEAFAVRYKGDSSDRLLIINLGGQLDLSICPEPLLAPSSDCHSWKLLWSSEDTSYGGRGTVEAYKNNHWNIPAHSAQVLLCEN